ncbi:MAG: thermonuclease family protein [Hyphomonadaceae bacterium]|nr:thermonuclease family protein [Hyphomonadaceae bacterium]
MPTLVSLDQQTRTRYRAIRLARDLALAVAFGAGVFLFGWSMPNHVPPIELAVGAGLCGLLAFSLMSLHWRALERVSWRWVARLWPGRPARTPVAITSWSVVDGDTIDDKDARIRYRIANIDAPETDDRAACAAERALGERAKAYAHGILRNAQHIEALPTGRIDQYGRTVAYLRIDGRDFGAIMVRRGFAVRWSGRRETWCGLNGLLAQAALQRGEPHPCGLCGERSA